MSWNGSSDSPRGPWGGGRGGRPNLSGTGTGYNGSSFNATNFDDIDARNRSRGPGWWNDDRDGWSPYASSDVTYVIATCYLSFLCFVAMIMCFKTLTRLRVIAAMLTVLGLSIAVVGYFRASNKVLPNVYWAWNFLAEALAVIALAIAIVSVGSGFYPLSSGRNIYARMSFAVIGIYTFVSFGTFAVYVYQKVVRYPISAAEVLQLRIDIVNAGLFDEYGLNRAIYHARKFGKLYALDPLVYGVADYTKLSVTEQTFYMRPSLGFYLGHQLCMVSACAWVCLYLFIPLIKAHRHGPAGRPVDSDMMAIGVWYLTCLISLAIAYLILNVVYCFDNELLYKPQIQALDLCLRITIGPIFFLPAPKMLIRFYRNHFKKFRGNSANKSGSNGRWGSRWHKGALSGGNGGSGSGSSNTDSRTRYDSTHQPVAGSSGHGDGEGSFSQNNHAMSRLGGGNGGSGSGGSDDNSTTACGSFDTGTGNHYRFGTTSPPPPPPAAHKHLKLSRSRDRGLSVESSRVLTKDFECDSSIFCPSDADTNHHRDSYHQDYNSGGMIMLDHRKDLALDSLASSTREKKKTSMGLGLSTGTTTYGGFDHPKKPPKLALSLQDQQFLQSPPTRAKLSRADSADSPSRTEFPRSPILA
ncbi:hypothetical protein BGX33_007468 [Mortierella sp. NVP41]|nr:hypothetical protein BGX33_007468 [Mortierella sp. NVP41]